MTAVYRAFRKEILSTADTSRLGEDEFARLTSRRMRYDVYWSAWENTLYDGGQPGTSTLSPIPGLHAWSPALKAAHGLYRHSRGVFNVAHRLGELHASTLISGRLDPLAGDGRQVPSCFPILDATDPLRAAIAGLWTGSNFDATKTIWLRYGAVLGDAVLRIVDDERRGRVYLHPVHPKTLAWCQWDEFGHVTGYVIEERRPDPTKGPPPLSMLDQTWPDVAYQETCEKTDGGLLYRTFLNGRPYDWGHGDAEWTVPYDFVPLVTSQHLNVGLEWGLPEYAVAIRKDMESDDLGSKVDDAIRVLVHPAWVASGVTAGDLKTASSERDDLNILTIRDPSGKVTPFVANYQIDAMSAHVQTVLASRNGDYPELRFDEIRSRSDASAAAIAEARKPAESKLQERRGPYLAALKRAMQMAVSVGGIRGYPGYEGFGPDSFASGALDFGVGDNPVFAPTRAERLAEALAEGQALKAMADGGLPLRLAMQAVGYDDATIEQAIAEKAASDAAAIDRQRQLMADAETLGGLQ